MLRLADFRPRLGEARERLRGLPVPLVVLAALLILTGCAFIHSASTNFSEGLGGISGFATRQVFFTSAGVLVFLWIAVVDYRRMRPVYMGAWVAGMVLLALCFLFGREINGAKSWIVLGPISLQVSEFCKPLYIITMAGLLQYRRDNPSARALWGPLLVTGTMLGVIILQPDFGTAMVFVPVFFAMTFTSGIRARFLVPLLIFGMTLLPAIYFAGAFKAHQKARIDTYVAALTGAPLDRSGDGYHVTMSMNAVGNGGLVGQGYGDSTLSQFGYLPERHTDFVFSVIAEETGLAGSLTVIMLFLGLVTCCFVAALQCGDPFGRTLCVGIGTAFMAQFTINIGMACGLMPVTGIPLPLVSYGGSSLLASLAALGLVASVHLHPSRVKFRE